MPNFIYTYIVISTKLANDGRDLFLFLVNIEISTIFRNFKLFKTIFTLRKHGLENSIRHRTNNHSMPLGNFYIYFNSIVTRNLV